MGPLFCCTTKPIYWHWVAMKEGTVFIADTKQGERAAQKMLKRWACSKDLNSKLLKTCSKFLKVTLGVREWVIGCMVSPCTILWLVGGDKTECCFRNLIHQPGGSNCLRSACWWSVSMKSNFLYLVGASISVKQLRSMAQAIIHSSWGGTKSFWLCWIAKWILFCFAWQFSFAYAFSHFSKYISSLELGEGLEGFSTNKSLGTWDRERGRWGLSLGRICLASKIENPWGLPWWPSG